MRDRIFPAAGRTIDTLAWPTGKRLDRGEKEHPVERGLTKERFEDKSAGDFWGKHLRALSLIDRVDRAIPKNHRRMDDPVDPRKSGPHLGHGGPHAFPVGHV